MSIKHKKTYKADPIWVEDPSIILQKYTEFFPIKRQSREERINSLVRMSLYAAIILSAYHSNIKYMSIFLFFILFTFLTYTPVRSDYVRENIENTGNADKECIKPTLGNPFMNVTMNDYLNIDEYGEIVDRAPACDINNPEVKRQVDEYFNNNLYNDVSDLFGKVHAQRNFYTMPSTTIPNDRESFQKWLYNTPQTCKENQDYCDSLNFEDVRANRFIFPEPERNPVTTKKMELNV